MAKKDKQKLENLTYWIIGVFILAILLIVVVNYLRINKNIFTYKGANGETFTFTQYKLDNNTLYSVTFSAQNSTGQFNPYKFTFHYSPYDVEDVYLEDKIDNKIFKNWIYLTQNPDLMNKTEGRSLTSLLEFGRLLGTASFGIYQINTQAAYTNATNTTRSFPVKTCSDANQNTAVIEARLGNRTAIYSENGCVIVMGSDNFELIKGGDKLAYHLLGLF